jgi:hypothetical protein
LYCGPSSTWAKQTTLGPSKKLALDIEPYSHVLSYTKGHPAAPAASFVFFPLDRSAPALHASALAIVALQQIYQAVTRLFPKKSLLPMCPTARGPTYSMQQRRFLRRPHAPSGHWGGGDNKPGEWLWLGTFKKLELGTRVYDTVVWQLDGSHGPLNFPKVKIHEEAEFLAPVYHMMCREEKHQIH